MRKTIRLFRALLLRFATFVAFAIAARAVEFKQARWITPLAACYNKDDLAPGGLGDWHDYGHGQADLEGSGEGAEVTLHLIRKVGVALSSETCRKRAWANAPTGRGAERR